MKPTIYNLSVKTIDGATKSLFDYKGDVLLIVNLASKCGYTPQYAGLEQLHREFGARGLRVLGFPANEFGAQEPGTDAEIKDFCTTTYDVTFPMFAKVVAKGEGIAPLYRYLTSEQDDPKFSGDLRWNFTKFLVGRDGQVIGRFDSKVDPKSPELISAITAAL